MTEVTGWIGQLLIKKGGILQLGFHLFILPSLIKYFQFQLGTSFEYYH